MLQGEKQFRFVNQKQVLVRLISSFRTVFLVMDFKRALQGGLDPNKISGLGVDFGHLVRCLLLGNKDAACKPSMIFR